MISSVSGKQVDSGPRACDSGLGVGGREAVFPVGRLAEFLPSRGVCKPPTPPAARLLRVLSSVSSDYLELTPAPCTPVSTAAFSPGGLGLGGLAPARSLRREHSDGLNAGEPQAP